MTVAPNNNERRPIIPASPTDAYIKISHSILMDTEYFGGKPSNSIMIMAQGLVQAQKYRQSLYLRQMTPKYP